MIQSSNKTMTAPCEGKSRRRDNYQFDARRMASMAIVAIAATGSSLSTPAAADSTPNPAALVQAQSNPQASGALAEGRGVMERSRPEYDASGLRLGSFFLYPTFASSFTYDDNVYRLDGGSVDDVFMILSPRLDLRSQWSTHALQLYAQLDRYEFHNHKADNRTNWILGASGRLDVASGSSVNVDAFYFDTHESRTSPEISTLARTPTRYKQVHANAAFSYQPVDIGFSAGIIFDRYEFSPTRLSGGGQIDNSDRNRDAISTFGKVSYAFAPEHLVYAQVTYDMRNFDHALDRNGLDRSSDGYRVDAGIQMMLTPLLSANAFAGYLNQKYSAPLSDIDGFDFGARLDWFVTDLVTLHFTASRTISDTTILGASSIDERNVGGSVDYEFLRNLIFQGHIAYSDNKFQGSARDDKLLSAGLNGKYLIGRNLSAYADYTYSMRDSNAPGRSYSDNQIMIGIKVQY